VTATKSWGPTLTETVGREVDYQVAAPTEREHPPCTERLSLTKECGWKDGDRGGLAEWKQIHGKKKEKVCLDSTGLLMEGVTRLPTRVTPQLCPLRPNRAINKIPENSAPARYVLTVFFVSGDSRAGAAGASFLR
jgi:hypothetical protein